MEKNNAEYVNLWARLGVTIDVPVEVYQQLQDPEIKNEVMKSILKGELGEVYLNGETYFPDLEENGKLAEVNFNFYEKNSKIAFLPSKEQQSFFYTFGTDSRFPYQKGWVEVQAEDRPKADALFRNRFPDVHKGVLNCSFVYTKEQFEKNLQKEYTMFPDWRICHDFISTDPKAKPLIEVSDVVQKKSPLADKILDAQNRNSDFAVQGPDKEAQRD